MNAGHISHHSQTAIHQFLDTATNLELKLDRALSDIRGIAYSDYRLLATLASAGPGGFSRIDLASAVGSGAHAVTRSLKPLVKLGYVTTQRNTSDARQSLARITPAGLELLHDAHSVLQDTLNELPFSALGQEKMVEFGKCLHDLRG